MFTLIYLNGRFNRPDTLQPFLETNVGKYPLMQIDCVTPYHGTERGMVEELCRYLSGIDPKIGVTYNLTQNISQETNSKGTFISFMVIQVHVSEINKFN